MQVNNEVGAVNDAEAIRRMLRRRAPEALLHVDGVQGFLKVPFDAKNCDLYSISGHKIHAPKGIGALYLRQGTRFAGGQMGGGQEKPAQRHYKHARHNGYGGGCKELPQ